MWQHVVSTFLKLTGSFNSILLLISRSTSIEWVELVEVTILQAKHCCFCCLRNKVTSNILYRPRLSWTITNSLMTSLLKSNNSSKLWLKRTTIWMVRQKMRLNLTCMPTLLMVWRKCSTCILWICRKWQQVLDLRNHLMLNWVSLHLCRCEVGRL